MSGILIKKQFQEICIRACITFAVLVACGTHSLVAQESSEESKQDKYWVGVRLKAPSPEVLAQLNFETTNAALIDKVVEDSPAEKAGLKQYDLLLLVDGMPLEELSFVNKITEQPIEFEVARAGKKISLELQPTLHPISSGKVIDGLGLAVEEISLDSVDKKLWRYLSSQKNWRGTKSLLQVEQISPLLAKRFGIKNGDYLVTLGKWGVRNMEHLRAVFNKREPTETNSEQPRSLNETLQFMRYSEEFPEVVEFIKVTFSVQSKIYDIETIATIRSAD